MPQKKNLQSTYRRMIFLLVLIGNLVLDWVILAVYHFCSLGWVWFGTKWSLFTPANAACYAVFVRSRSKEAHAVWTEAQKLVSDGLEDRSLSILEDHLCSNYPEHVVRLISSLII